MADCEVSLSEFESSIAHARFDQARSSLRALIRCSESGDVSALPFDPFELHGRLDPGSVSLDLLLTDFTGQPERLKEAQSAFKLNGQDDLALLTALAAGAISEDDYRIALHELLQRGYFACPDGQTDLYPLGYPNCLEERDLFEALENQDDSRLQDLLYDGLSRAWDHAFPDYDVLLEQLCACERGLASAPGQPPGKETVGSIAKPLVRFGMASLLDTPIAAVLADACGDTLPIWSVSPLQIAASLLQGMARQAGREGGPVESLAAMSAAQRWGLVEGLYFSSLLPSAPRLDLSPQVLEFAGLYGSLRAAFRFIIPPVALDRFPRAYTACPAFYRHYPVPFLAEPDALMQVLQAVRHCSQHLLRQGSPGAIQLPDELMTLPAAEAHACLIEHLSLPSVSAPPSALFVRSWAVLQMALSDGPG